MVVCGSFRRMAKKLKKEDISPAQVRLLLERMARLLRSASHSEGLHPAQWEALRYLAHANSFSNSPRALASYLGATKGTISQTVTVLIKKGLVEKAVRSGDVRSVVLNVTPTGHKVLSADPLAHIEKSISDLGDKTRKKFSKGLLEVLHYETLRQKQPRFGDCGSCRYFRKSDAHYCMKFEVDISPLDPKLLCVEFASSN